MNYKKIYDKLIEYRIRFPVDWTYFERHHIIPRSMGGSDYKCNLVKLTAREHFIAHLLLHKIYNTKKTAYAIWMMKSKSHCHDSRYFKINSKMYERIKILISYDISLKFKGNKNPQYETKWISDIDNKISKRICKHEEIPIGWVLGRNLWNNLKKCNRCGYVFLDVSRGKVNRYCSDRCHSIGTKKNISNVLTKRWKSTGKVLMCENINKILNLYNE